MKSKIKVIDTDNGCVRKDNTFFYDEVQSILVGDVLVEVFLGALKLGKLCAMRVLADFVDNNRCSLVTRCSGLDKSAVNKDIKKLFNTQSCW